MLRMRSFLPPLLFTLAYAARVHPRTVAATVYHEDAVLRICRQHVPPGVRVAGELDYARADALSDALAGAVRLDHDVHLNLNHLRFIDAGAAAVILQTAAHLPPTRRMIVVCPEPIERTLTVAGREVLTAWMPSQTASPWATAATTDPEGATAAGERPYARGATSGGSGAVGAIVRWR